MNDITEHVRWISFNPYDTYVGRYKKYFIRKNKVTGSVLDVGSRRDNSSQLQEWGAEFDSYTSIDITSESSLSVIGDAAHLPFKDDSFDTVLIFEVLEHIPFTDITDVVEELYRVLRPDGHLLSSTPFVYPIHDESDHVRLTSQSIRTLFENCEFSSVEVYRGGGFTETTLHELTVPVFVTYLPALEIERAGWGFLPIHMIGRLCAIFVHNFLISVVGQNVWLDNYYLLNFLVARK